MGKSHYHRHAHAGQTAKSSRKPISYGRICPGKLLHSAWRFTTGACRTFSVHEYSANEPRSPASSLSRVPPLSYRSGTRWTSVRMRRRSLPSARGSTYRIKSCIRNCRPGYVANRSITCFAYFTRASFRPGRGTGLGTACIRFGQRHAGSVGDPTQRRIPRAARVQVADMAFFW